MLRLSYDESYTTDKNGMNIIPMRLFFQAIFIICMNRGFPMALMSKKALLGG